jgi:uncharacterized membrane protein YdjX (TVP38/TMEM64 family)
MIVAKEKKSRVHSRPQRTGRLMVNGKTWSLLGGWLRTHWIAVTGVVAFAIAVGCLWGRLDLAEVHRRAQSVPVALALVLMVLLPLLGCPVILINLAAGIRFGIAGGLPLVAGAIVLHHTIAFGLAKLMPGLFGKLVAPIRRRLPEGSHGSVTVFATLLPGIPYWMQIYSLPLIGVPLRTLLFCAVPFHIARSLIALVGGDLSEHLTAGRLIGLAIYGIILMSVCAYAGRRIRWAKK